MALTITSAYGGIGRSPITSSSFTLDADVGAYAYVVYDIAFTQGFSVVTDVGNFAFYGQLAFFQIQSPSIPLTIEGERANPILRAINVAPSLPVPSRINPSLRPINEPPVLPEPVRKNITFNN